MKEMSMAAVAEEHIDHYDPEAAKIGMWLFLFTEALLFGMLFLAFAVYLHMYRFEFVEGSRHLNRMMGTFNTAVLLTSSLTMALSIAALQRDKKKQSLLLMGVTILFAGVFLVVKAFEWGEKFHHDLYPKSPTLLQSPPGAQIFYGLYYTMTGFHALHIIIGIFLISSAALFVSKGSVHQQRISYLENTGLYWHLVDLVWIFLFPLFYLIG
jgi:cytochrome c oxidase subunit III